MHGMVFIEMTDTEPAALRFELPGGVLSDWNNPAVEYFGPNQAVVAHPGRTRAYLLDSGSRAGDDNSWCNLKCSGCYRPLQASRWYLFDHLGGFGGRGTGVQKMRRPENSLGRFRGSRGTELDNAGLRPYPPLRGLPLEVDDGNCWLDVDCADLHEFFDVPRARFR